MKPNEIKASLEKISQPEQKKNISYRIGYFLGQAILTIASFFISYRIFNWIGGIFELPRLSTFEFFGLVWISHYLFHHKIFPLNKPED